MQAIAGDVKFYAAKRPCRRGHIPIRYTRSGACWRCIKETHAQNAKNPLWKAANNTKARAFRVKHRARLLPHELSRSRKRHNLPAATVAQPNSCECCGRVPTKKSLGLDHDHKTGEFRGFLCYHCNPAIGALGDNIEGLEQAIAYLKMARARTLRLLNK